MSLLYAGKPSLAAEWTAALREALPGVEVRAWPDAGARDDIRWAVVSDQREPDLHGFPGLRALFAMWAGIEHILANPALPAALPLVRMIEPGLTEGMRDYVVGHVMRRHLGMDAQTAAQTRGAWAPDCPPLARDRRVTVLGLGALGAEGARALAALGFRVTGWSRSAKTIAGIDCLHGPDGLGEALARAEILVLLAPATAETRRLLDARTLAQLPPGAHVINPARGALIDDNALLAALDSGRVASATLDVFDAEPLPADHRYWRDPGVAVTPHVASVTRAPTAARAIASAIADIEAGRTPPGLVDRARGY